MTDIRDRAPARRVDARIPPHNLNAEESLLGAMLLSRDAVNTAAETGIGVEHFYKPAHQHVFDAMRSLLTIGEPIGKAGGTNTMKIVRVGEYR